MNIKRYDTNHIAVQFSPILMWVLGLVFFGLAVASVLFFGSKTTLECARGAQSACTLTQQTFLKAKSQTIRLDQLHSAWLSSNTDSEGKETYQVILRTSQGELPLTSYSSSGYISHKRIVDNINNFLQDPGQTTISAKQDSRMLLYILGAIFGAIGLLMILLTSRITVDLDRSKGLATMQRASLITRSSEEILLSDLSGAEVEESRSDNSSTYRVALVQRNGQRTPLTVYYSSGRKGKEDLADEINRFLLG